MDTNQYEWLPHLEKTIPIEARHNRTSLYTIALEGWRRGLILSFHNQVDEDGKALFTYSLKSKNRTHYFDESSGDKNTHKAFKICRDKSLTSEYLMKANVPIPRGRKFGENDTIEDIIGYANKFKYPLVVKPTDESSGRGVITNIPDEEKLKESIEFLKQRYSYKNIIVQEHVQGDEIRIYVLDDKVIAATNRLPANVIGDGKSTIAQLIERKNKQRKKVPHLYFRPIVVDATLRKIVEDQGFTLESILKKDKRLFVRKVSNISTGGDPIDVTDQLTDKQKNIAIKATKSIPGLVHCGVDMIVPEGSDSGVILELNTRPGIGSHLFPLEGRARDIPKALIDFYFPETIDITNNIQVYFDLQAVFDAIDDGYLTEMEMKQCPQYELHSEKWLISTKLDVMHLYSYLRKIVIANQLNGYIKKEENNSIKVLISHKNIELINNLKIYIQERMKLFKISQFRELKFTDPVKIGFTIIDGLNEMSPNQLGIKNRQISKEVKKYELSIQRLKSRISHMGNSSSWKITFPLRYLTGLIKR